MSGQVCPVRLTSPGVRVSFSLAATTTTITNTTSGPVTGQQAAGPYTFTAAYSGDSNYKPSSSVGAAVTVGADPTTTAVTGTTASPVAGQPIAVSAAVTADAPGSGTPASQPQPLVVSEATFTTMALSVPRLTYGDEEAGHVSVVVTPEFKATLPGTVTVIASGTTLCTIALASDRGSCTLPSEVLAVGSYHVIAVYAGNSVFRTSASPARTLRVIR